VELPEVPAHVRPCPLAEDGVVRDMAQEEHVPEFALDMWNRQLKAAKLSQHRRLDTRQRT
jgi:hypothetical protein